MISVQNHKIANASFLAILFVVMIHVTVSPEKGSFSWWVYQMTANGCCRWAVPLFFAVAGYFLSAHVDEQGWWKVAVRKRVRTLLLPFLIWNFLFAVYGCILVVIANVLAGRELTANLLSGWDVLMYFGVHPVKGAYYGILWFVETLFLFVLASPLFVWAARRMRWGAPVLLFVLSYLPLKGLPLEFKPVWMMYFVGGISARFCPLRIPSKFWMLGIPISVGLIWAHKYHLMQIGSTQWDATPLPAIIILLVSIWSLVPDRKLLPGWLNGVVFPVYVMHGFVTLALFLAFPPIKTVGGQFFVWAVAVVSSIALANFIRSCFPVLNRIMFGNRSSSVSKTTRGG